MKIELHLHTSKYSECSCNSPQEMMAKLIDNGYDAVYITEHNTVWPQDELNQLQSEFPQIKIFPGIEITTGSMASQHLVVLGTNDPKYSKMSRASEVLENALADGHLTILAHPYRFKGGCEMLDDNLLPDAIEFYTGNHGLEFAIQSLNTAGKLSLPLTNAGDVHALDMIGKFWLETDQPLTTADDIREIIKSGNYTNKHKPL